MAYDVKRDEPGEAAHNCGGDEAQETYRSSARNVEQNNHGRHDGDGRNRQAPRKNPNQRPQIVGLRLALHPEKEWCDACPDQRQQDRWQVNGRIEQDADHDHGCPQRLHDEVDCRGDVDPSDGGRQRNDQAARSRNRAGEAEPGTSGAAASHCGPKRRRSSSNENREANA